MTGLRLAILLIALTVLACSEGESPSSMAAPRCNSSIKYAWDETHQETRKTIEVLNTVTSSCVQKRLELSNFEKGLDVRKRAKVVCRPQALGAIYLRADGNFYEPRNGNVWLALDASGEFRRLTIGQDQNGNVTFSRDLGCWYARTDGETEPVSPRDYGAQLLLDLGPVAASTELVRPSEIFRYTRLGSSWQMARYDQNYDADFSFCPYLLSPPEYCSPLRNGNPYFEPESLDVATRLDLLNQAILIRSEYNFVDISSSAFESEWALLESYTESPIQSWKYAPTMFVDVPNYIWDTWAGYIRGEKATMPEAFVINLPTY